VGESALKPEEAKVLEAAAVWARAMEALTQTRPPRDEEKLMADLERAQFALLKAVLVWQLRSR
jgi:hypothetical protein